jgi:hypothetical protein
MMSLWDIIQVEEEFWLEECGEAKNAVNTFGITALR